MSRSFHNSINASGETLARYERDAMTQEDRVMAVFSKHAPFGLTPSQAHRALNTRAPLTSIRRAITNLTERKMLERMTEQTKGPYGKPEYRWRITREPEQKRLV